MKFHIDAAHKSLNHYGEELCGDMVEIHHTDEFDLMILADGMGSGVKANILSTLTSKILASMFLKGAPLEDCVQTVVKSLPICQERQVAYATFTILQIFKDGRAYLVEYDNPGCIFIRDGKLMEIPKNTIVIEDKEINEYHFNVQMGDCFVITSDGTLYAGTEMALNMNWTWKHLSAFTVEEYQKTKSPIQLANKICQKCNELYGYKPGDDTTAAIMRVSPSKELRILVGPPSIKEFDAKMVSDFMEGNGDIRRVICGESTTKMVARELGIPLRTFPNTNPPVYQVEGVELATEGIMSLNYAIDLLQEYVENDDLSDEFFEKLDADHSGAKVAQMLIDNCTDVIIFAGMAEQDYPSNPYLPIETKNRADLVKKLHIFIEALGRYVTVKEY
ncbi:hypothetical protein P261_01884 [Lachnospiraceae bacterium TWA4]|nr:hypothetical protein P261_01884 [Lachnospiraceae bacterium TWA4]